MTRKILLALRFVPIHLLLWAAVWLFYVYTFGYAASNGDFAIRFATTLLPVTMIATYFVAYYLIPRYLFEKRYLLFSLYLVYVIVTSLFIVLLITFFNLLQLSDLDIKQMPLLSRNVVFVMIMIYLVVGIVSFIKLLNHNLVTANRNQELENKLLEGQLHLKQRELHYLRQQIHPHFLFNTLNTVYGFALKQSTQTPELILKLSKVLDYILNQIDKPLVPISQEIEHIEAYIGLEQIRFADTLKIELHKDIVHDLDIPPMLFTPFVENAFKHGKPLHDILEIKISFTTTENCVLFIISNTTQPVKPKQKSHQLGISNTQKRLETLYPERHNLEIKTSETHYTVHLQLDLHAV